MGHYSVVVLDFETTGLSPDGGDRAIEIGAVLLQENAIVASFQSLMNPQQRVSRFIEEYTGITNAMLIRAPSPAEVMEKFAAFIAGYPLVAHNASFDRRFLDAELLRIRKARQQEFACSMLVARRLYPDAPSHRLETLVRYKKLLNSGVYHRALADAEMTAHLWIRMVKDLKAEYRLSSVPFSLMRQLGRVPKGAAPDFLRKIAAEQG
jgi:DNA polymerase-3 subunit epsilon